MESFDRKSALWVGLRLPPPISTNALHRAFSRGGRVSSIKSAKYRDWLKSAGDMLESQNPACVPGAFGVRIAVPAKCRLDLDNCCKATLDLLVSHNVIEGDGPKHLQRLEVWRGTDSEMVVSIISTQVVENRDEPSQE